MTATCFERTISHPAPQLSELLLQLLHLPLEKFHHLHLLAHLPQLQNQLPHGPVLPLLHLPLQTLHSLLNPIHLHLCLRHLLPQLLQHLEVWPDAEQLLRPAALPGHLGLQAAHLGRDCPGLLLQPIITSSASASPFLANSLLHVGPKKTSVRFSKRQSHEPPLNINIF